MACRRAVLAFLLVQCIAFAAAAQEPAEFGRASSGEIVLTPKGASPFSGSLQLSLTGTNDRSGRGTSPGYGMTVGGTLLEDRLWFFAAGSRQEASGTRFAEPGLPQHAATAALGARAAGRIGDRQDLSAFFEAGRTPTLSTTVPASFTAIAPPSSFLSLRYTGLVSSDMSFSASFTRGR